MRLTDFDLFSSHRDYKSFGGGAAPVREAIRYEIARRDAIEAPFNKLLVNLIDPSAHLFPPHQLLNVMTVWMRVDPDDVPDDPLASDRFFLDLTRDALQILREELGWHSGTLDDVIETLRSRADIRTIELERLAKTDAKSGNAYVPLYVLEGDGTWEVVVRATAPDGQELGRERVASSALGLFVERAFPVRTAIIKDGRYVLRDRERKPLASTPLV